MKNQVYSLEEDTDGKDAEAGGNQKMKEPLISTEGSRKMKTK
jgi:hypothetical protein